VADPSEQPAGGVADERICWQCGETYSAKLEQCPEDGSQLVELDPADTQDMLIGRVFDYRFRIVGKLGEGGMSHVYAARRLEGEGQVALKILKADFLRDPEVRKRFMYEARVISNLNHPNAVDLFDFGQAPDGSFYMVMELLQGGSLADRLDGGALTYRDIFHYVPPICGVLGEAHENDVIHRDLKPENIYLAQMGEELPVPKLLDFGIAKHLRSRTMTKNDQLWGTPAYMSPEQASGESVQGTADIYAMGVMVYELIAGVLPFRASTAMGYAVKHMHREVEPISSLPGTRDVPRRLESFVLHMLEKDPAERPPTMAHVAEELRAIRDQVFDNRLLGMIPAKQVHHDQLEEPVDDEAAVAPGEMAAELDEALRGAETELIESPPDAGQSSPPEAAVTASVAESSSRGSEFETAPTGFDGSAGPQMVPWFQRPLVVGAAAVLMTLTFVGAYLWMGRGQTSSASSAEPAEATELEESGKQQRTEHAARAAGQAAHVGGKARTIAVEIERGDEEESEASPSSSDDDGRVGRRRQRNRRPSPDPKPSSLTTDESPQASAESESSSETESGQSAEAEGAEPAAEESEPPPPGDDEELSEDNVNEALESTF